MRELRKETENLHLFVQQILHNFQIRNERTPKGDGKNFSLIISQNKRFFSNKK